MSDIEVMAFSPVLIEIVEKITKAAESRRKVLITGDSGTGKTILAYHYYAVANLDGEFVPLNCATITDSLFESELFGHVKGAFTGAEADKKGKVEQAEHGVLFLDEIGELKKQNQAKLLTLIDGPHAHYTRVGGTKPRRPNFALVCASSKDVAQMSNDGSFNFPLYARISCESSFVIPPLKDRPEDIEGFAKHFLESESRKTGRDLSLDGEATEFLKSLTYAGNLRTLEKIVINAADLVNSDGVVTKSILMDLTQDDFGISAPLSSKAEELKSMPGLLEAFCSLNEMSENEALKGSFEDFLKRHHILIMARTQETIYQTVSECLRVSPRTTVSDQKILSLYKRFNGNGSKVARHLGMHHSTVNKRLRSILGKDKGLH